MLLLLMLLLLLLLLLLLTLASSWLSLCRCCCCCCRCIGPREVELISRLIPSKKSAAALTLLTCAAAWSWWRDSGTGVESCGAWVGEPERWPEWESCLGCRIKDDESCIGMDRTFS